MLNGTWETTDLGSAAFAHSRGLPLEDLKREDGQVVFVFSDPKREGPKLEIAFANSNERKFDESVRALKRLAFGGRERR